MPPCAASLLAQRLTRAPFPSGVCNTYTPRYPGCFWTSGRTISLNRANASSRLIRTVSISNCVMRANMFPPSARRVDLLDDLPVHHPHDAVRLSPPAHVVCDDRESDAVLLVQPPHQA